MGRLKEEKRRRGRNVPGTLSSPLAWPACSITCKDLVASPNPIPNASLPWEGTTNLPHPSAVMILINSPPPESKGEGNSNPGDTGKIEGEILNTWDPDLEGGLKELELPTRTCREEEEDEEVLRCLVADSPSTPRAERLFNDMTCIASRTEPWAYNDISGLRGISSEGERKVWLKNCGGFVMRCSRTLEAVRIDGGSVVNMTRCTPDAKSGMRSRRVEVGENE
jgi:hypothetical protein